MTPVADLTARFEGVMLAPRHGPGVCEVCLNLTRGFDRCFACSIIPSQLDVVVPISYSVAHEQLHHVLAGYKRLEGFPARRYTRVLAAILWRFLARHEQCVADAAGARRFDLVTTVPSADGDRDARHPLRLIVDQLVGPTRGRHQRLLACAGVESAPRKFDPHRYLATRALDGERILLIDDTWTTGANAQSAAAALRTAGAGTVAAVVIGRHLNREWHENDVRLRGMPRPFDWGRCALCASIAAADVDLAHQHAA